MVLPVGTALCSEAKPPKAVRQALCRSTTLFEQVGMSSIDKQPNGRWRARYRDKAGRSHSKTFDRKADAQKLSRRRRPRHPPRRVDRSEAGTHPLRAVGRSVVGDNGEAAPDALVAGTGACSSGMSAPASRVGHCRRSADMDVEDVHHASPRSRSLAEVHKGLCLCPLACDEERRAGESAQGQSGCRPQHPNSHAANCTKATS